MHTLSTISGPMQVASSWSRHFHLRQPPSLATTAPTMALTTSLIMREVEETTTTTSTAKAVSRIRVMGMIREQQDHRRHHH